MIKDRLFVFGDSWACNYFSKENKLLSNTKPFLGSYVVEQFVKKYNYFGHWIDHMESFYDVYSYAVGSASNEQIIHQIGNLPEYQSGDRIIMMFAPPSRFKWVNNKKIYGLNPQGNPVLLKMLPLELINLIETQYVERTDLWMDTSIQKDEQKFLNLIPVLLKKYNPILITWNSDLAEYVDSIEMIDLNENYTNIKDESFGTYVDGHLGVFGNYELFKFISNKLKINISDYSYNPKSFNKQIL